MKDDAYAAETEEVLKHVALTGESPVVSSEALIRAYSNVRRRLKEAADIKACIVCDEIVDASDSILLEPATMTQDPPAPWLYHLGKTHRYRIDNADDPDVLIAAILGVTRGARDRTRMAATAAVTEGYRTSIIMIRASELARTDHGSYSMGVAVIKSEDLHIS
eukprot:gene23744-28783_t